MALGSCGRQVKLNEKSIKDAWRTAVTDEEMDAQFKAELYAMMARVEGDPNKIALRALWLDEHIPDIQNEAQYKQYREKEMSIKENAEADGIYIRSPGWSHSQDGVLAGVYGAKQIAWELAGGLRRKGAKG